MATAVKAPKVLTVKDKFIMAVRCIPAYEHITEKYAILDNGDLYFVGDKSWLKVEGLIPCNGRLLIPFNDLATIIDMPGNNPSISINGNTFVGTGGRTSVTMKATTTVDLPSITMADESTFADVSDVFSFAKEYYALVDINTTINAINIEIDGTEKGVVVLHDTKFIAAAAGGVTIEGDLTKIGSTIENAAKNKAKIASVGNMLYMKIEPDATTKIYSGIKLSAVSLSEHTRQTVQGIFGGTILNDPEVIATVSVDDAIGLSGSFKAGGETKRAKWRTSETGINFVINETNGRIWEDNIAAKCNGELEFHTRLITKEAANAALAGSDKKDNLCIKIDPFKKYIGYFPEGEEKSFMVTGIMLPR